MRYTAFSYPVWQPVIKLITILFYYGPPENVQKYKGWEGKLIPKSIVETEYFFAERAKIDEAQEIADGTQSLIEELVEKLTAEEGALNDCLNDKGNIDKKLVNIKYKELKKLSKDNEEYKSIKKYVELTDKFKKQTKIVKELNIALDKALRNKYYELSTTEIKDLLVNKKWYFSIFDGIKALYETTSNQMANRISELVERYEFTLPYLEKEVEKYETKVKSHLERMGFRW